MQPALDGMRELGVVLHEQEPHASRLRGLSKRRLGAAFTVLSGTAS
jgi:hypothetical protein